MKKLIKHIESISNINNLNYINSGDVYTLLNSGNVSYCAAVIEPENSIYSNNILQHTIRITVVDKLTENESNLLDIYDNTRRILSDIVNNLLDNDYNVDTNYTVNYIKQDFNDKLAGVYASINIQDLKYYCNFA